MNKKNIILALAATSLLKTTQAQVVNSGFETVSDWVQTNNATYSAGGVANWTYQDDLFPNEFYTITETVSPAAGSGMMMTYAGSDSFSQDVNFAASGIYTFSIQANALDHLNSVGTPVNPLAGNSGAFEFVLDGVSDGLFWPGTLTGGIASPATNVTMAGSWQTYTWDQYISAGTHNVGVRNSVASSYHIAYDNFSVTVPEPSSTALLGMSSLCILLRRRR